MRMKLSNEQLGEISRRVRGIEDKIENQGLDYQRAIQGLQQVFEGTLVINGVVRNFGTEPEENIPDIDWLQVYEKMEMRAELEAYYQLTKEVNNLNPGFWTVPVLKGVTPNMIMVTLRNLGVTVNTYVEDLDKDVTINHRDANKTGDYSARFLRTIEADPKLANKSAKDLTGTGVWPVTLTERLLLELGYFLTTGNHLDVENVTLCAGSRYTNGQVPRVKYFAGVNKLCIDWSSPDYSFSNLRARAVV